METLDNNNNEEKYPERLTTYDQIIDAAGLLTNEIKYYRESMIKGRIKPYVAKSWIRLYNKALNRFIEFISTVEIRISEIKGFKRYFIGQGEQIEIPYYVIYIRRTYGDSGSINNRAYENSSMITAISFEYHNKASMYSNRVRYKPTLHDILYYIKETFFITDVEDGLITLTRNPEYMWSIEKIKNEYPHFKEILEISEKLESIFSGVDMLTIPINVHYPGGYEDYFEEIFRLEEIEKAKDE
jgi:hypothetical protein